jgi:hypothetical protein
MKEMIKLLTQKEKKMNSIVPYFQKSIKKISETVVGYFSSKENVENFQQPKIENSKNNTNNKSILFGTPIKLHTKRNKNDIQRKPIPKDCEIIDVDSVEIDIKVESNSSSNSMENIIELDKNDDINLNGSNYMIESNNKKKLMLL